MAWNLLTIVQNVCKRVPITPIPTGVIGVSDPRVMQLLQLAQEVGDELIADHTWSALRANWSIPIVTNPETDPFPTSPLYDRLISNASVWRSGSVWIPLSGPITPDAWHLLTVMPGAFPGYWRMSGTGIEILGVSAGETCTVEYVTKDFILAVDGVTVKAEWTADTDTPRIDDRLFMLGMIWRWKQSKGLEYAEDMTNFEKRKELIISADRQARPGPMSQPFHDYPLPTWPGHVTVP